MPITIKGIRVDVVSIKRNADSGISAIENAQYSLVSSADKVLAQQAIGGYGSGAMKLEPSQATTKALQVFMESYQADIVATLGLE